MNEKRAAWAMSLENKPKLLGVFDGVHVLQYPDLRIEFIADGSIDADGANGQTVIDGVPQFAYRPDNKGLDHLANAGYPNGSWHNVLLPDKTDHPLTTIRNGYTGFISTTAYQRKDKPRSDANRYLDSVSIPYLVVNPFVRKVSKGIVLGAKARITHTRTGRRTWAVVGDVSGNTIGEMSIAAANAIGINSNPRHGGESEHVIQYEIFPNKTVEINGETFDLMKYGA